MRINEFLNYITVEKRFSKHTFLAYQNDLSQFLDFIALKHQINHEANITHFHIRTWTVSLMQEGVSPRSINRKLSCLKSFFKFLKRRNYIQQNPMLKVVAPKMGKRLPSFVEEKQLENLFEHVEFSDDFVGIRDKLILEMLYSTGIRRAELVNLDIKDFDFYNRQIKILGKGGKERILPFGKQLHTLIEQYIQIRNKNFNDLQNKKLFLTDNGKNIYDKLVYNKTKYYLTLVTTIEQKSPHVLRHSFATHLSNNGADLNAIKELMGHANLAATQVYTHNSIEKLKKVYEQAHPKAVKED